MSVPHPVISQRFRCCYLLTSLKIRCTNHTYIGYTVNPQRRIRQHNGELTNGAKQTSKKRPWEMVLFVSGFSDAHSALYFEWCWQHPQEAKGLREAIQGLPVGNAFHLKAKVRYLFQMLLLPQWCRLPLTVHWVTEKYKTFLAGCPNLPTHMTSSNGPLASLFIYQGNYDFADEDEDSEDSTEKGEILESFFRAPLQDADPISKTFDCSLCDYPILPDQLLSCSSKTCAMKSHVRCLAIDFLEKENNSEDLLPTQGKCNQCGSVIVWSEIISKKRKKLNQNQGPTKKTKTKGNPSS